MTGNIVQHKTRVSQKYSTLQIEVLLCYLQTLVIIGPTARMHSWLSVTWNIIHQNGFWRLTNLAQVQIFTLMSSSSQILQVERQTFWTLNLRFVQVDMFSGTYRAVIKGQMNQNLDFFFLFESQVFVRHKLTIFWGFK